MKAALLALLAGAAAAQDRPALSAADALEHVRYLASDELEGRDTGSAGERKAGDYLAARLAACSLEPAGDDGTFFQAVPWEGGEARNVLALVRGTDPELGGEVVVVGAHYDHVGLGEHGSLGGPEARGRIHNGADDNASGVSAALEMAELLAGAKPRRSVLFAFFTGEERGNVGSTWWVEHPTVPLERTIAMLNLDMVGGGETGRFQVWGVGTAAVFDGLLDDAERDVERWSGRDLEFHRGSKDPGRGDNAAFVAAGVPALLFHTGGHERYHRPEDDWQHLNAENLELVLWTAHAVLARLAVEGSGRPAFDPVGR